MELKTRSSFAWKETIDMLNSNNSIVIDHGSVNLKYGFSGTEFPAYITPTIIGKPKLSYNSTHDDYYVGNDAIENSKTHFLNFPIEDGKIINWEDMEDLWIHMFTTDLNTKSSEHPLMITDGNNIFNSGEKDKSRIKITEAMIENFEVPAIFIENQAILSLYAVGRTHGIVISSGYESTTFYPCHGGVNIKGLAKSIKLGGKHITNFLRQTISFPDNIFKNSLEEKIVTNILKEGLCYFAIKGIEDEINKKIKKEVYDLPDGNTIEMGNERFIAPEGLLNPQILGKNIPGIPEILINCLEECDKDIRNDLCNNVLLEGCNTLFPLFPDRLLSELKINYQNKFNKIRVIATDDRKYYSWLGGSIVSSLETFEKFTIKREDYFEKGCEQCVKEKYN